ncbi:VapC toxin family PIN domain ribonuclease [Candidatus Methylomirabilis limnetica]|jgi:ribonuclease VapC|uniref:Ribonuclease VapC n=1 Tax=Candidatus Methylomirabilis limnetica TaxID=2033718 RepID=A0A2T4TZT2_9BACT|nr:type II toxin-antitoxin system VapC family toxin [Candidatus Methylomirabilis limnetica]PTL36578.1 VapC toxin family PIN domain ribonuclease [Candidatus Methylomirabilis limnetica]
MIVDSSAVLAILFNERDADTYAHALARADVCRMSAANFVEVAIVVEAQTTESGSRQLDAFFRRAGIAIEAVTEEQAHVARQAYTDFGKGRHPAGLNFGDCFAYALAKVTGESLLFKGEDFNKTDITSAL